MLRIVPQTSAAAAKRYYSAADYYSQGQETAGLWGGRGATRLGLAGPVTKEAFEALCDNRDPRTGRPLTPRSKAERRVGYDFNFSAPKGVSLLYGLTHDDGLLSAFRGAVRATMDEVETEMKTRVRRGGQGADRVTGEMTWAEFVHTTGRPVDGVPDPHLHAHCFAFNCTWDNVEQRYKAGQFGDLKRDAPYWQAAFRARLAEKLTGQGYALTCANGDFEIAGLRAAAQKFRKRTEEIERTAERLGVTDPGRKAELGAKTRQKKAKELGWGELRQEWFRRLDADDRRALGDAYARRAPRALAQDNDRAVGYAIRHAFERDSVVPEKQLLAEALRHGVGAATVDGVRAALRRSGVIVAERDGRRLATTPEVLAEERGLIAFAREGRGACRPLAEAGRAVTRDWLNAGQQAAVRHAWDSCDRVLLIRGAAGTGKTTALREAVEGIEAGGRRVFAFAPSADASRGTLRREGFTGADTVARLLVDEKFQAQVRGQVILVDEAGLLGTRTLAQFFGLAGRLDARVILVGDRRQHGSVERGAALRLLEERAGLPVAEVTEIQRQKDAPGYKRAVKLLSEGKTAEGFQALDRLGWVRQIGDDGARERRLAADYLEATARRAKNGGHKTALVIAPTHAEGARVTAAIRAALRGQDRLGAGEREVARLERANLTEAQRGEGAHYGAGDVVQFVQNARGFRSGERATVVSQDAAGVRVRTAAGAVKALPLDQAARFQLYRLGTLALAAGDRVRVTANGTSQDGHRLNNGALRAVRGFTKQGDVVLDNGWVVGKDFGHLAHGYVVTSHASQGKTVDQVFIAQGAASLPASSREQFYVSVSRGKERAVIYTDDKAALRQAVQRSDQRLAATELVARKPPLRERLMKHVAHLQRLSSLARAAAELARPLARDREAAHGR